MTEMDIEFISIRIAEVIKGNYTEELFGLLDADQRGTIMDTLLELEMRDDDYPN